MHFVSFYSDFIEINEEKRKKLESNLIAILLTRIIDMSVYDLKIMQILLQTTNLNILQRLRAITQQSINPDQINVMLKHKHTRNSAGQEIRCHTISTFNR